MQDFGVAAGSATLEKLIEARSLLDKHYRWADTAFSGTHNEIGVETRKRLAQMIMLIRKIVALLTEAFEIGRQTSPGGALQNEELARKWQEEMQTPVKQALLRRAAEIGDELEVFTESFYLFAHRAWKAARTLPVLGTFEAVGVRDVRNKLIEHAEGKDSGVLMSSFGYGAPIGPVVKALRLREQVDRWPDKGLFVNANEFADNLTATIEKALS